MSLQRCFRSRPSRSGGLEAAGGQRDPVQSDPEPSLFSLEVRRQAHLTCQHTCEAGMEVSVREGLTEDTNPCPDSF